MNDFKRLDLWTKNEVVTKYDTKMNKFDAFLTLAIINPAYSKSLNQSESFGDRQNPALLSNKPFLLDHVITLSTLLYGLGLPWLTKYCGGGSLIGHSSSNRVRHSPGKVQLREKVDSGRGIEHSAAVANGQIFRASRSLSVIGQSWSLVEVCLAEVDPRRNCFWSLENWRRL